MQQTSASPSMFTDRHTPIKPDTHHKPKQLLSTLQRSEHAPSAARCRSIFLAPEQETARRLTTFSQVHSFHAHIYICTQESSCGFTCWQAHAAGSLGFARGTGCKLGKPVAALKITATRLSEDLLEIGYMHSMHACVTACDRSGARSARTTPVAKRIA